MKLSCAEGPFKALLRDLSEIIRKLLTGGQGPNFQRTTQRIELSKYSVTSTDTIATSREAIVSVCLAKLTRENDSIDDLKTLLSTLGFDDDRQVE